MTTVRRGSLGERVNDLARGGRQSSSFSMPTEVLEVYAETPDVKGRMKVEEWEQC